ncbi:MAG: transposase, partial [Bacteroidota bacterium]
MLKINESRWDWLYNRFEYTEREDEKIKNFKFWQDGNEAKGIHTNQFLEQKLDYIHQNPVMAEPEHYRYSSARNYAGVLGLL